MAASPERARLYCNVCLIDCDSRETLDELLTTISIDRFLIRRLSERTILVDAAQRNLIARALARRGRPYRIVDLAPVNPDAIPERKRQ